MKNNLFLNLYNYRTTDLKSSEENFITESFVYFLKLSLEYNNNLIFDFLNLFKCDCTFKQIEIKTQKRFITNDGKIAIPDITIIIDKLKYIFIEVKVSASLTIEQIEIYKRIKINNPFEIITLTIDRKGKNPKSITWNDVHSILRANYTDNYLNQLINEFKSFLIHKNMAINKVSNHLEQGIIDVISLMSQISYSIDEASKSFEISKYLTSSSTYFGYNIIFRKNFKLWIGVGLKRPECIKIQIIDDILRNYLLKNLHEKYIEDINSRGFIQVSLFNFTKKDFFRLETNKQIEEISDWLEEEFSDLDKFINEYQKIVCT